MGLRINTNVPSLNAQKNLRGTQADQNRAFERLSSGQRINKAADDAAGLAISENLKGQIRGFRQASRNSQDGISFVQVAEGGMNEISNILTRMRELGVQAASDTIGETERGFLDIEYQQVKNEIQRIAETTRYNGTQLLDATGGRIDIQVGIYNNDFQDRITYDAGENSATLDTLGIGGVSVLEKGNAQESLAAVDAAMLKVGGVRANLGAIQNRLTSTINNLATFDENISAANSRIRDADVAAESAELASKQIMLQAGISVLAQSNQAQSVALKLLG
jgi:flagellin